MERRVISPPPKQRASLADQPRGRIDESGLSSYAVAGLSDVAEEVIRRLRNKTRDLKLETAGSIANALGVAPLAAGRRRSPK